MHYISFILAISISFSSFFSYAQVSPFGTGEVSNQLLDALEDNSVVFPSQSGWGNFGYFPDPDELLGSYTYDLYIPPSYDGTEPYGLVTFINSGNNGGVKSSWKDVLDEKKLIWVAGDNIGNSIFINIRMGVAWAAVYRMKELLNIDTSRIYTSGNSGGARMASNLAFIYPEWISASVPSCGASYLRQVDQDYETHEPDSHYESILSYTPTHLEYVKSFDQRHGIMTAYSDFREGDIMNIYHNGFEPDGFKAKFLEISGGHCATSTEHFRDAVNFVEHPHILQVTDEFDAGAPGAGDAPIFTNAEESGGRAVLHDSVDNGQIKSKELLNWNDPKGVILRSAIQIDPSEYSANNEFSFGIWHYDNVSTYCSLEGNHIVPGLPGILLKIDYQFTQPRIHFLVENPDQPFINDTLFIGQFSDWNFLEPINIKYHLWDQELRIEFSHHLTTPISIETGINQLDDSRSLRVRWNDITSGFWSASSWENGGFITMTNEKKFVELSGADIWIENLEVVTGEPGGTAEDCTCQPPSNLQAFVATIHNVQLNWDAPADAYRYQIKGRKIGDPGFANAVTFNNFKNIGGIMEGSAYEWKVRTQCLDESISEFSELDTFLTPIPKYIDLNNEYLRITPNPANETASVTAFIPGEKPARLQMFNASGKLLKDELISSGEEILMRDLNLEGLGAGMYHIVMHFNERIITRKLIISPSP